ncbi:MAG: B12-binding domain-containing radical SAM protein [Thermoanaerobaculia bacterium]
MTAGVRKHVLISEPQLEEMGMPYLPVMWSIFKTYWEHHGRQREAFEWLPPVHRMGKVDALLAPYDGKRIDVLGVSCYTWNSAINMLLAAEVKRRHPDCVVIAGGPDPDVKDPDFFVRHPYIDIVAVKDGEIPFTMLLEKVLDGDTRALLDDPDAFAAIPGLYLPNPGGPHRFTAPAQVPVVFDSSPYIEQTPYYEQLMGELQTHSVIAVWETNRGCPFSCSYCDWGSSTMSKVRRFDMERVRAEAEWFGKMKVGFIMLADANFGMLPRDLEIADLIIDSNRTHGFPAYFSYNTAKNNPERTVEIARRFVSSGLASSHILSIQHTDRDVLAATDRANISVTKQIEVVRALLTDGIPMYVQLILGIPGDTYAKWKRCFSDLMEWGIHSYFWIYPYNVLPNAPASEPAFRAKWEYETRPRYVLLNHGLRRPGPFDPVMEAVSQCIVSSKTFTHDDWVEMMTYAAIVKALHNCSLTQIPAIYLRFTHGLGYADFYDAVIEEFFKTDETSRGWYEHVRGHYRQYLEDPQAVDYLPIAQLPRFEYEVDPSRWLYVQVCFALDAFFESLESFLVARYPEVDNLTSAVRYQRDVVVVPDYDRARGKIFVTDHDWPAYFSEARRLMTYAPLREPEATPGALVAATDQVWNDERMSMPLLWNGTDEERWMQWIQATVVGRNSAFKNNHQKVHVTRGTVPLTSLPRPAAGQISA